MIFPTDYNPADAQDILRYAKWLIGKTFYDVLETDLREARSKSTIPGYDIPIEQQSVLQDSVVEYGNTQRKGGLGNLIEEHFFHYDANSNPEADFSLAGLELKVTPFEERVGRGKNAGAKYYVAGERLVLTMIDFNQRPIEFDFLKSHVWKKCRQILLVYYLRNKEPRSNLDYRIKYVDIFAPNEKDRIIITQDYYLIMKKIANGKAHEISESDTMYLGACTKGSTAAKSIVLQIENNIPAQKRAFCFKMSYMTTILNEYFINTEEEDSVVTDDDMLARLGFEGYLQFKVNKYVGKSDRELCSILGLDYTGNKSQWVNIAFAILGVKSNKAEEFQKANIVIKATRIEENGNIKENTSFPPFKFKELAREQWIDADEDDNDTRTSVNQTEEKKTSTLQAYFASTKFLFVVFKKQGNDYFLKGCQLWNMPYQDLNETVRKGWEQIRNTIITGIKFNMQTVLSGNRVGKFNIKNNLPKKEDNPIIHIRPHAKKAYYKFEGYEEGDPADGNELPDGRWMTTQCFWLNNTYVKNILREDLKQ